MIWLVRRPVEKLAMQSKKDFGLELILMKVPLYCYSRTALPEPQVLTCRPQGGS
jgi:hypothetical protein